MYNVIQIAAIIMPNKHVYATMATMALGSNAIDVVVPVYLALALLNAHPALQVQISTVMEFVLVVVVEVTISILTICANHVWPIVFFAIRQIAALHVLVAIVKVCLLSMAISE